MKREYMKPEVEKISFCYRDQVVAASGGGVSGGEVGGGSGNIFESNDIGSCYDLGDVGEYLLESWLGSCDWINGN